MKRSILKGFNTRNSTTFQHKRFITLLACVLAVMFHLPSPSEISVPTCQPLHHFRPPNRYACVCVECRATLRITPTTRAWQRRRGLLANLASLIFYNERPNSSVNLFKDSKTPRKTSLDGVGDVRYCVEKFTTRYILGKFIFPVKI